MLLLVVSVSYEWQMPPYALHHNFWQECNWEEWQAPSVRSKCWGLRNQVIQVAEAKLSIFRPHARVRAELTGGSHPGWS